MKQTGLMFKGELVRAILDGRKTQTRRVVKGVGHDNCIEVRPPSKTKAGMVTHVLDAPKLGLCPMGNPGDLIYVRETWQHANYPLGPFQEGTTVFYRADYLNDPHGPDGEKSPEGKYRHWQPSIHMPKSAARIWLEITGVRVERLQDISEADAIAEGIERVDDFFGCACWKAYGEPDGADVVCPDDPIGSFRSLWDSTGGDWQANPWVWVIDFKRTNKPAAN